jgi:UTP--glucose-1-phosphate uridylyltransferase
MNGRGKSLAPLDPTRLAPGMLMSVRQQEPLGLGHAVWCARHMIGDEPFAVLLPDDLMVGSPACLAQMIAAYSKVGGNIVCAQQVAPERTASYGIITPGATNGAVTEVRGLVEKPRPEDAPSTLAVVGRYILQPEIMKVLDTQEKGAGGEIQLTDAMEALIGKQPFHSVTFDGERHDCGDKLGFVKANIALALDRGDVGPDLRAFVAARLG